MGITGKKTATVITATRYRPRFDIREAMRAADFQTFKRLKVMITDA